MQIQGVEGKSPGGDPGLSRSDTSRSEPLVQAVRNGCGDRRVYVGILPVASNCSEKREARVPRNRAGGRNGAGTWGRMTDGKDDKDKNNLGEGQKLP